MGLAAELLEAAKQDLRDALDAARYELGAALVRLGERVQGRTSIEVAGEIIHVPVASVVGFSSDARRMLSDADELAASRREARRPEAPRPPPRGSARERAALTGSPRRSR